MADQEVSSRNTELAELREHTRSLAANLAGPLRRVRVTSGDATIEVEWQQARGAPEAAPSAPAQPAPADADDAGLLVTSPMVGTFYRAPSPDAPPFVEVGQHVRKGDPLCLIEVMKLFTTIASEHDGRVVQIGAENAELVEFGRTLFVIEPA